MFEQCKGVVDKSSTERLLYPYNPENDVTTGDGEPISRHFEVTAIPKVKDLFRTFVRRRTSRCVRDRGLGAQRTTPLH